MTGISRRRFLQAAGTAGLAVAAGPALLPARAADAAEVLGLDNDPASHVLRRFTFGPSAAAVTALRAMPGQTTEAKVATWFEQQLGAPPTESPDSGWDPVAPEFRVTTMTAYEAQGAYLNNQARALEDAQAAACVRAVCSEWQVREVLVEFWSNHFSTFGNQDALSRWSIATQVREVLRANALGTFRTMLRRSAESAHLLNYLDNHHNRRTCRNENYARELLELHTLGADALYGRSTWRGGVADPAADQAAAESDVRNAAVALTGWEFYGYKDKSNMYPTYGSFLFTAAQHQTGPLTLFDGEWTHPNDTADQAAGIALLDFLAGHPATAEHLCRKLCAHFVDDDYADPGLTPATSGVLADAIAAYLSPVPSTATPGTFWAGTDIKAVLRVIRASPEFAASSGAKWRRPVELVTAMLRAVGAELIVNNHASDAANPGGVAVRSLHATLGHKPYDWRTPEGFPETWRAWLGPGPLLKRWNAASTVVAGLPVQYRDATLRWVTVPTWRVPTATELAGGGSRPSTARGVVRALTHRLCRQQLATDHEGALLAFLGHEATPDDELSQATLDAKGPELVRLILSSPYFQLR